MEQTIIKIGQSPLSMLSVPLASLQRSNRLVVKDQIKINKIILILEKVIQRSVRLIWSAEK